MKSFRNEHRQDMRAHAAAVAWVIAALLPAHALAEGPAKPTNTEVHFSIAAREGRSGVSPLHLPDTFPLGKSFMLVANVPSNVRAVSATLWRQWRQAGPECVEDPPVDATPLVTDPQPVNGQIRINVDALNEPWWNYCVQVNVTTLTWTPLTDEAFSSFLNRLREAPKPMGLSTAAVQRLVAHTQGSDACEAREPSTEEAVTCERIHTELATAAKQAWQPVAAALVGTSGVDASLSQLAARTSEASELAKLLAVILKVPAAKTTALEGLPRHFSVEVTGGEVRFPANDELTLVKAALAELETLSATATSSEPALAADSAAKERAATLGMSVKAMYGGLDALRKLLPDVELAVRRAANTMRAAHVDQRATVSRGRPAVGSSHVDRAFGSFSADVGAAALFLPSRAGVQRGVEGVAVWQLSASFGQLDLEHGVGSGLRFPVTGNHWTRRTLWQVGQRLSVSAGFTLNSVTTRSNGNIEGVAGPRLAITGLGWRFNEFVKFNVAMAIGHFAPSDPSRRRTVLVAPVVGLTLDIPVYRALMTKFRFSTTP